MASATPATPDMNNDIESGTPTPISPAFSQVEVASTPQQHGYASEATLAPPQHRGCREYLMENIDPAKATFPLAGYCFMTGFIDAITFSAAFVWCGFQTGNTIQLALALARLFSPGNKDVSLHPADRIALISILTFLAGASLGRIGDRIGNNRRIWLALGTFLQALFTMGAAICIWQGGQGSIAGNRGELAWTNALSMAGVGFASATVGLQGIMGKRVNSQFATTVVLTTVWCELIADPKLFQAHRVITRDHKFLAIFALFLGGFVGKAIVDQIGSAAALGVGVGMRIVIALGWLVVPALALPGKNDSQGKNGVGRVMT